MKKSLGPKRELKKGWNTFELSFPNIKKAQSATMTLSVSLGEAPTTEPGALKYNLELNGEKIYDGEGNNTRYFVNITDITGIVEKASATGYGGKWKLNVWTDYNCLIEEFSIDVAGYLNPLVPDTDKDGITDYQEVTPEVNRGWSTNPFLSDTDRDGWRDGYEIYTRSEMTNPLCWDTDGDSISDPHDLDPLRDCIVEVKIVKAGANEDSIDDDYGGRVDEFGRLQVGIVLGADFDYQGVYTRSSGTEQDSHDDWVADFNDYYYFDIDDNKRTFQLDKIMLFGQLEGYHSRGWYACDIDGGRSVKRFSFSSTAASGGGRYGDRGEYYVEIEYYMIELVMNRLINERDFIIVFSFCLSSKSF